MKELTEKKKLEILRLFLEGYSYDDISSKSDVAKGSVVNTVTDFRAGRFPALADVAELADALRELSVELRKRGAGVSEALLGSAFFFRLSELGVTPDKLWLWVEMSREMSPAEAPLEEFSAAAVELFRLKQETGESYDSVVAKWTKLRAESDSLGQDVEDLRSEKKELETTRATLTEESQKLREEKESLEGEAQELSAQREALRKEASQLGATRRSLKVEVEELNRKVSALQPEVEALERLGFRKDELETLKVKLEEIASNHNLEPEAVTTRFFQGLDEYGGILGLEKKRERLEGEVVTLQAQKESLEHSMSRLGLPPQEVEEAVKSLISLKKKGVAPSIVVSYHKILCQAGLEPHEVEKEALELGGLRKGITSRREELKRLDEEESKCTKVVEALRAEETKIKGTIRELKESAIKQVKQASVAVIQEVRRVDHAFLEDVSRWGNIKAEIGRYEEELKLARYFGRLPLSKEALAALVEEMPALVVAQYLTIALVWCTKKFNPKLKPPQAIVSKYYRIAEYTDVELTDLLAWSLTVFTEGGAHGST